ncbi:MAG: TorF family putative porin [Magnetococcus sp. YQC-3]
MTTLYKFSAVVGWLGMAVCAGFPLSGWADAAAEPPQTHTFTANMGVVSNYIFRGQSQTWNKPAFQGGVDYAHADGWYAGLWASNISDRQYAGGWAELDYYGGFNGKFNNDWSWTLGVNGVYYPSANYDRVNPAVAVNGDQSYDNFEVNAGLGYKWITLKVYASLTDYFGANTRTGYKSDSKGTTYWDLSANVPLPEAYFTKDVTLPLHIGRTEYPTTLAVPAAGGGTNPDYTDYKIGISKGLEEGWSLSAAYTYADGASVYNNVPSAKNLSDTENLVGGHTVFSITKSF